MVGRLVLTPLAAFPLDNSIITIYTILILQQGGGEHGRKEIAQTLAGYDFPGAGQQSID